MSRLFDMDGPFMSVLNRVGDLIWLNILVIICCIPVVTAGASLTALYYMTIKMVRKEEGYIARGFFKSFRQNFKQATVIWLLCLFLFALMWGDLYILNHMLTDLPKVLSVIIGAISILLIFTFIYVFPVLSRFDNSIKNTIKNAFFMSILNFPKTILIMVIYAIPIAVLIFVPTILPAVVMLGIALPAYAASFLFSRIFKRFEPEEIVEENELPEE